MWSIGLKEKALRKQRQGRFEAKALRWQRKMPLEGKARVNALRWQKEPVNLMTCPPNGPNVLSVKSLAVKGSVGQTSVGLVSVGQMSVGQTSAATVGGCRITREYKMENAAAQWDPCFFLGGGAKGSTLPTNRKFFRTTTF